MNSLKVFGGLIHLCLIFCTYIKSKLLDSGNRNSKNVHISLYLELVSDIVWNIFILMCKDETFIFQSIQRWINGDLIQRWFDNIQKYEFPQIHEHRISDINSNDIYVFSTFICFRFTLVYVPVTVEIHIKIFKLKFNTFDTWREHMKKYLKCFNTWMIE